MELKLKKAGYNYYEPMTLGSFSCETMREHIVPDSCADIARVVETTAQVWVTGREAGADGRLCASGSIDISVLYIPEKGDGPCALRLQLPFQSQSDSQWDSESEFLDIRGEVRSIETRLLNPRKVLIRANLDLYPLLCRRTALSVCTGTQEDESIELLCEQRETRVIAAVREKEFTFVEELPVSPGRGSVEEIISKRLDIRAADCKLIGSKLVVKGIILASVLYRESGGRLELMRAELPFSQILDGSGLEEEWENDSVCRLLNAECTIGGESGSDDRHLMTLTLQLRARVTVWRTEKVCFIADLYSTSAPVLVKTEEITLRENSQRYIKRQNIRQVLETGNAVKTVLDTEVGCGGVRITGGGESLEIPVWVKCLYLDENDALHSVRREFGVTLPTEQEQSVHVEGTAACRGDVMVSILPDGIELRFPVECVLESSSINRYVCVSGGETEEGEEHTERFPSVVLRKIGQEEKLWSVAKHYRTTCRAIMEVNELADERQIPGDRLLLIPRKG